MNQAIECDETDVDIFRAMVQQSVDGLLVVDTTGIVRFANPAAVALFSGRTRGLVGFPLGTPAILAPVELLLPDGEETRVVEMRSCAIQWDGRPATLATLRDISQHKKTEHDLRERVKELRCLSELSRIIEQENISIEAILDQTVRLIPAGWQFTEDAVGRIRFQDHVVETGEFSSCVSCLSARLVVHGTVFGAIEVGYRSEHPMAFEGPFLQEERALLDMLAERLGHVIGRRRTEESLADSERKYRLLTDNTLDVIWAMNLELEFSYVNPAITRLLGYTPEEFIGTPLSKHCDAQTLAKITQVIEHELSVLPHGRGVVVQIELFHKDGSRVAVEVHGTAVLDTSGAPIGLQGTTRDIARRLAMEAQLHQAQKMESVGRLAGGVAHDFNNMLTIVLGNAELALEQLDCRERLQEYLRGIVDAGRRSSNLTRQLLAFARKQVIAPKSIDLNDIIAGLLKMLGRLIGEDLDLLWQPGKRLANVRMDPVQIDQLMANLIINARDAIAGVGHVWIETGMAEVREDEAINQPGLAPGRYVTLTITDDGPGMDAETVTHIFEPFFSTKPVGEGTGLGLATVYGIVKQNEGYIDVRSRPGEGTSFRISFPAIVEQEPVPDSSATSSEPKSGTETILLVEDEAAVLALITQSLHRLGYTVLTSDRPQQAIQRVREFEGEIDLLMTDVVMPEMNGRELFRELVALRPGLKCLFMSGYPADVIAQRGILEAERHYLPKPFDSGTLATKLRQVLEE